MDIKQGYVYHIDDKYFDKVNDSLLMKNKERGAFRPTFLCIKDEKTSLLWMVPMSSQAEKYEKIAKSKIEKYGESLGIVLGEYNGKKSAFLLQNMFPIVEKYIHHIHTKKDIPIPVSVALQSQISTNMKKLKELNAQGKKVVFPDIKRLEKIMLDELSKTNRQLAEMNDGTSEQDIYEYEDEDI